MASLQNTETPWLTYLEPQQGSAQPVRVVLVALQVVIVGALLSKPVELILHPCMLVQGSIDTSQYFLLLLLASIQFVETDSKADLKSKSRCES